jgi:hypothetical protein
LGLGLGRGLGGDGTQRLKSNLGLCLVDGLLSLGSQGHGRVDLLGLVLFGTAGAEENHQQHQFKYEMTFHFLFHFFFPFFIL